MNLDPELQVPAPVLEHPFVLVGRLGVEVVLVAHALVLLGEALQALGGHAPAGEQSEVGVPRQLQVLVDNLQRAIDNGVVLPLPQLEVNHVVVGSPARPPLVVRVRLLPLAWPVGAFAGYACTLSCLEPLSASRPQRIGNDTDATARAPGWQT